MAGAGHIDFERITQVYREESSKKQLVSLEPDFYDAANEYLKRLEKEAAKSAGENPTAAKTQFLQDELRKARKRMEQVYQYRERKIALLAQSKASGVEVEPEGMTTQDAVLFERLLTVMNDLRGVVFFDGKIPAGHPQPPQQVEEKGPESGGAPPQKEPRQEGRKSATIYVTEDIPPFAGLEVTYKLMREDIVSLPEEVAEVLVKRGKARRIEVR